MVSQSGGAGVEVGGSDDVVGEVLRVGVVGGDQESSCTR